MPDRRYSLEEIQDRLAIEDLYDRQLAAAEAGDWSAYDTTFLEDAVVDLSDFGEPARRYPDYRAWLIELAPRMLQAQRVTGGLRLQLHAGRATTHVPVVCHVQMQGPDGVRWVHNGIFYDDELLRTEPGWRIARRRERLCWDHSPGRS